MPSIGKRARTLKRQLVYLVSDLGSSFGTTNFIASDKGKGNLDSYVHSKFIRKGAESTGDFVDFEDPRRPSPFIAFNAPEFLEPRQPGMDRPAHPQSRRPVDRSDCSANFRTIRFAMPSALRNTRPMK